jgi:LPS-assembly lipoprotein
MKRILLTLASWRFRPVHPLGLRRLHAAVRHAPASRAGLTSIETIASEGRAGYLLREQLDDALGHKQGSSAAYKLYYSVNEFRFARGVRLDNVANRYELRMTVDWRLMDAKSGAEATKGKTEVSVTYDSADQPYAAIAAQQDGQERAATEAARKIQLDLATWLAGKKRKPA